MTDDKDQLSGYDDASSLAVRDWWPVLFVLIVFGAYVILAFYPAWPLPQDIQLRGAFGDSFGVLSALFNGLAFAGLIITIVIQSRELRLQRKQLTLQRSELRDQRRETKRMADAMEAQIYRQRRGLLVALRNDIRKGVRRFYAYRKDNVFAPSYRLPIAVWTAALPVIGGLNILEGNEISILDHFFSLSEEMNYCLERLAQTNEHEGQSEQYRARLKVSHMLDPEPYGEDGETLSPLAERAMEAISEAIDRLE